MEFPNFLSRYNTKVHSFGCFICMFNIYIMYSMILIGLWDE